MPVRSCARSPRPRLQLHRVALLVIGAVLSCGLQAAAPAPNVILIIGDGMDDNQITIARNYLVGVQGKLQLDRMPMRGSVQVLTVNERDPSRPVYVADSANSATAIATGSVTSMGRISTAPKTGAALPTVLELASAAGLRTGLVTTSSITDATPAVFAAHIAKRICQGPNDMGHDACAAARRENGGAGSIAEQLARSDVNVLIGGGAAYFAQRAGSDTLFGVAQEHGFQVADAFADIQQAQPGGQLLALLAEGLLPVRTISADGRGARHWRDSDKAYPEPVDCVDYPAYGDTPPLAELTREALRLLDNPAGFFLMVESAMIDKGAHVRRPCASIGELEQLDESVTEALAFAEAHGNTLVLVTADHGQAAQILPAFDWFSDRGFHHGYGWYTRLRTREGGVMGVGYATSTAAAGETHTGVQVPVFAAAPAGFVLPSHVLQPQLFTIMRDFLRLDQRKKSGAR